MTDTEDLSKLDLYTLCTYDIHNMGLETKIQGKKPKSVKRKYVTN